jgi:hypothetical protein
LPSRSIAGGRASFGCDFRGGKAARRLTVLRDIYEQTSKNLVGSGQETNNKQHDAAREPVASPTIESTKPTTEPEAEKAEERPVIYDVVGGSEKRKCFGRPFHCGGPEWRPGCP